MKKQIIFNIPLSQEEIELIKQALKMWEGHFAPELSPENEDFLDKLNNKLDLDEK